MPRQGRIHIPGGLYHIIIRGIERRRLFQDTKDRLGFLRRFGQGVKKHKVKCYAWVLMSNHAHFLLSPAKVTLSDFMQSVLTGYAVEFNRKYKRVGHVFQNRYKSILCEKENYFLALIRYIHRNPIRAGLVKNLKELEEYRWCGYRGMLGIKKYKWHDQEEVLRYFGKTRGKAIKGYMEFMSKKDEEREREQYEGGGIRRSRKGWEKAGCQSGEQAKWVGDERILGEGEFVEEILREVEEEQMEKEIFKKHGWTWNKLEERICGYFRIEKGELRKKWRIQKAGQAKAVLAHLAKKRLGYKGSEIAGLLAVSETSIARLVNKGEKMAEEIGVKLLK